MFDTPLRSAALGVFVVAVAILALSLSDRLLRLFDRRSGADARKARQERFRGHTLVLLGIAIAMAVASDGLR